MGDLEPGMTAVFVFDQEFKTWKYISLSTDFNVFICYLLSIENQQTQKDIEAFMRIQSNSI
jgi:hypothetical protein